MNVEKINISPRRKRILITPLDWGLGHATRCIPLVKMLQEIGVEVIIAASGTGYFLLKVEFPDAEIIEIPGYQIRYANRRCLFLANLLIQGPRIASVIRNEERWLNKAITQYKVDAVISDNRFGMYTGRIPSIFMTHQLEIETGSSFFNRLAQFVNYRFINRFQQCWVPDQAALPGLAGKLSHPEKFPAVRVDYIGIASRIKKFSTEKGNDLLIILSGPEPQRTQFEQELLIQIRTCKTPVVLIRGLPGEHSPLKNDQPNLTIRNFVAAEEMSALMQSAGTIIARCGYSTVMDLYGINQRAILVPTPGQTEQEYLGRHLKKEAVFYTTNQEDFDLNREITQLNAFRFTAHTLSRELNRSVIMEWLETIPGG